MNASATEVDRAARLAVPDPRLVEVPEATTWVGTAVRTLAWIGDLYGYRRAITSPTEDLDRAPMAFVELTEDRMTSVLVVTDRAVTHETVAGIAARHGIERRGVYVVSPRGVEPEEGSVEPAPLSAAMEMIERGLL